MLILHSDWSSFLRDQYPELKPDSERGNMRVGEEAKATMSQQILDGK